jgi:MinD superfamily P-loop ATPase
MKIAIASGKGGTGKTLVSTNLFYSACKLGIPVTLVDCDAEDPSVTEFIRGEVRNIYAVKQKVPVIDADACMFCGKCRDYCHYHAIVCLPPSGFIQVIEELCHDCGACMVACDYGAITEKDKPLGTIKTMEVSSHAGIIEGRTEIGVFSPVPLIRQAIKRLNGDTLVILDSPPGISCPFIATVEKADFVVLVTEPTPFGLHDLELSAATLRYLGKAFGVIINKAGLGNRDVYEWLLQNDITLLLEIPFDKKIARFYSEGLLAGEEDDSLHLKFAGLLKKLGL